jgi:hypothetical protein
MTVPVTLRQLYTTFPTGSQESGYSDIRAGNVDNADHQSQSNKQVLNKTHKIITNLTKTTAGMRAVNRKPLQEYTVTQQRRRGGIIKKYRPTKSEYGARGNFT